MESSTSYTGRYITMPYKFIKNIGDLGGVDTFRLYCNILLHKNWRNALTTTPNILLTQLNREKQYLSKQLLIFFCFDFRAYKDHRLTLLLRVGEFPDPKEREKFIEQLDRATKDNQNCKLNVKKTSKSYTTIYSKSISLAYGSNDECDLDDHEAVTDKMIELYKSSELQKAIEIVDGVIQNFKFNNT